VRVDLLFSSFMCVCSVELKKSAPVSKLKMFPSTTIGQSETILLSIDEDFEHFTSYKLS
jgi:hypothetical protein